MYCPNCGKETSIDQRFCRSCGLGLEKTAQSLAEQRPSQLDENLQALRNRYEWWGMMALSVFGAGVLGLILFGIVYKMIIAKGQILGGLAALGFILIVACGLLSTYFFAKANEVKESSTKRPIAQPEAVQPEGLTAAEPTGKLLPDVYLEGLPSVTERTTDLLLAEQQGRKAADLQGTTDE